MKKIIIALMFCSLPSLALAEVAPVQPLTMSDPLTSEPRSLSADDARDSKTMMDFVAPADGAAEVYAAYVSNGYLPIHAMMLTNWDVSEGLRQIAPGIPENRILKGQIEALRAEYKPVSK